MGIFYDLHIHSCLSPCGDRDMTVNNIVNMAIIKGLELIALTDHNSSKNCPAFLTAAKKAGINAIAGMEINTSEEVHAVCLFRDPEDAMSFDSYVYERLPDFPNSPAIFGEQMVLDANDEIVGSENKLLINATSISFFELPELMRKFNGIYFPAHIDKDAFSLLSNLGFVPSGVDMHAYEIFDDSKTTKILLDNPLLLQFPRVVNSDAHYLWDISEPDNRLDEHIASLLGF